ncbi:RHS repeat-associated core domain-containing protein [Gilliamella sp. Fer4-1]|uniref:RHS repeat-associated core domain-containing protein n=1 Tax=Gilliamella sp. Fer4-1 TaxID=3120242 RepID=UPI00080E8519|nr:RHS repeat-associated core domain-containing protein [Gilliamella apicola]OCG65047.1 hypothetical protein A9G30_06990 [Gilliamella apicola]
MHSKTISNSTGIKTTTSATPIALTGSLGDPLYECQYNAYGQIINETYHQDDIDSLPDNPLRFQGQYYDEETGLHYNLNRYYYPFTGRYITQELGGLNSYQYVNADPINWIDPLGLIKVENNGFEGVGSKISPENEKYVDILSPEAKQHILYGDGPTSGGHMYPGNPGKTTFPKDWSADKIVHEIGDIATAPNTQWYA